MVPIDSEGRVNAFWSTLLFPHRCNSESSESVLSAILAPKLNLKSIILFRKMSNFPGFLFGKQSSSCRIVGSLKMLRQLIFCGWKWNDLLRARRRKHQIRIDETYCTRGRTSMLLAAWPIRVCKISSTKNARRTLATSCPKLRHSQLHTIITAVLQVSNQLSQTLARTQCRTWHCRRKFLDCKHDVETFTS